MPLRCFVHVSWTTYERHPMIGPDEAAFLNRFLPAEARRHRADPIALGLVADHVHMILRLPNAFDFPRLMRGLKGASARVANRDDISAAGLRWARGYDARSVSPRLLSRAIAYVRHQGSRHPDLVIAGPRS